MGGVSNSLSTKEYKSAYLLYGSESYLRVFYKNALKKALVNEGDNLNYSYFEGQQTDANEVVSLLETMPFMADYRVVIVENSGWFLKGSSDGEDEGKSSGSKTDSLAETIKNLPENTVVIFSEEKIDKRSKLFKAIQSKGIAEEFAEQTDDQLAKWLFNMAKAEGKNLDSKTAYYLVSECGKDMTLLQNEMSKLLAWSLEKDSITIEDVDTVCTHQINNKIFDMITAIALHKQKEALRLYYDLLTLRESPFHILSLLVRQYTQMYTVKDGLNKGLPASQIASYISTPDWVVKKIIDQVRRMNISDIKRNLEACAKADEDIKRGDLGDMMSVELLIISCSM